MASNLVETTGPTKLALGAVADGQLLKRNGSTVIGVGAGSVGSDLTGFPDVIPASPNAFDDEFNGSSLDGKWAATSTPASHTTTVGNGSLQALSGGTSTTPFAITQAPGSTFKITTKIMSIILSGTNGGGGLLVRDSVSNKQYWFLLHDNSGTTSVTVFKMTGLDSNNYSSTAYNGGASVSQNRQQGYLQVEQDASNIYFRFSFDGQGFRTVFSEGKTAWLTNVANQVGPFYWQAGCSPFCSFDWIRKA